MVSGSRRWCLTYTILICIMGTWRWRQLNRASVRTRGSWFLTLILHTFLHVSAGVGARRLRSIVTRMGLLIALAAQQQIRLTARLRDVAITGTIVTLILVALEEMLAQATDRLSVAQDPRILQLLLITVVPVAKSQLANLYIYITLIDYYKLIIFIVWKIIMLHNSQVVR